MKFGVWKKNLRERTDIDANGISADADRLTREASEVLLKFCCMMFQHYDFPGDMDPVSLYRHPKYSNSIGTLAKPPTD